MDQSFFKNDLDDLQSVKTIIDDVKKNGDTALKEYTLLYDKVSLDGFTVEKTAMKEAYNSLPKENIAALETAAENLRTFASKQLEQLADFEFEIKPGVIAGQRVIPIDRVAVYVPGGNFPLVSSLLMGAVPARTAGVKEIAVCTPPSRTGNLQKAMLAAGYIAGIDEMYTVGGVQAIAALAYGTETIKRVDKIVGPGNKYVTAAKKEVYGKVGIDFIAGPSEVMVIADESANPQWVAADLLAQAEHDIMASAILVTPSLPLAKQVINAVNSQLSRLETRTIAEKSIESNGVVVLVDSIEEAIELANRKAPEHLEIQIKDAETVIGKLKSYGTLFIGNYAAEVLGDYTSGLNHTLPTGGAARYTGGLSVRDFVKVLTTLRVTEKGIDSIGKHTFNLAGLEGLDGHAKAIETRMLDYKKPTKMPGNFSGTN